MFKMKLFNNITLILTLFLISLIQIKHCSATDITDQYDLDSIPKNSQWRISGDFLDTFEHGKDINLNRSMRFYSLDSKLNINHINICGYKTNDIIIFVFLNEENTALVQELKTQNLINDDQPRCKTRLDFFHKERITDFLDVFVQKNLISYDIYNLILNKISFKHPHKKQKI